MKPNNAPDPDVTGNEHFNQGGKKLQNGLYHLIIQIWKKTYDVWCIGLLVPVLKRRDPWKLQGHYMAKHSLPDSYSSIKQEVKKLTRRKV